MKPKGRRKNASGACFETGDLLSRVDTIRDQIAMDRARRRKRKLKVAPPDLIERIACLSDEERNGLSTLVDELARVGPNRRLAPTEAKAAYARILRAAEELYCRYGPAIPSSTFIRFSRDGECGWCPALHANIRLSHVAVEYSSPARWSLE